MNTQHLPLVLTLLAGAGCGAESGDLADRGRRVYGANCMACHHVDPSLEGPLGPAIVGSSRELIEARVLRAEYPTGHQPKRPTAPMTPLPYLEAEIEALSAYLAPATAPERSD